MKKKIILPAFLVLLMALSQYLLPAQNTWQQIFPTGDNPSAREGHSMVTIDGLVHLFGGKDNNASYKGLFSSMHVYLPGTQEWMEEEPENTPPAARSGHKAIVYNGKMYVFFGQGNSGVLDDLWEYNPDTNEWMQINPGSVIKPPARHDHSATVYGDKVYVVGGLNGSGNPLSDCWAYNFTNNQWEQYANIIGGNINGHAAVIHNEDLMIYGGLRNGAMLNPGVFVFSPDSDSWQSTPSQGTPYPTADAAYVQRGSEVFIFGGYSGYYEDQCFKWDLTNQQFTQLAPGPALAGASAAICPKASAKSTKTSYQEFVLFGGSNEGVLNDNTWIYTSDIDITGIESIPDKQISIKIFPNPAIDFITIETDQQDFKGNNLYYQLCDIQGRVLTTQSITAPKTTIHVENQNSSVFFIKIS